MGLKEKIRRKREKMLPERFRFNYVIVPAWGLLSLALVAAMGVLGAVYKDKYLLWIIGFFLVFVICSLLLILIGERVVNKEVETALKDYSYLFEESDGEFEETPAVDEEMNIQFRLKKDGLQIIYPMQGEAVFAEMGDDTEFVAWSDVDMALASDNYCRRVRFALVVVDKIKHPPHEYGYFPPEPFFLKMTKELFSAVVKLGLVEGLGSDFYYLLHNPKKGMKQILNWGYVKKL